MRTNIVLKTRCNTADTTLVIREALSVKRLRAANGGISHISVASHNEEFEGFS